ncbi:MAG: MFS transporter [Candidatus Heimdallarchaeota archaeon]|nr:MFS transporter [Candidatus Heimdallarchaeota archaeon]
MLTSKNSSMVEQVTLGSKLGYTAVDSSNALLSGLAFGSIDIFYLKMYKLNPGLMALSWILFLVWNAINDPLIGIMQDKTKTSIGRRIPYIRFGAIPYAIVFMLVWVPFIQSAEFGLEFLSNWYSGIDAIDMGLFWNHLLMLFLFDTMFTTMGLIVNNLSSEMAISSSARAKIAAFSFVVGTPAWVVPLFLPAMLLGGDNPNLQTFRIVMAAIAFIAGILLYTASYLIKENRYTVHEEPLGFWESISETFKNRPFLIAEVMMFAFTLLLENVMSGLLYMFDYVIEFTGIFSILSAVAGLGVAIYGVIYLIKQIDIIGLRKVIIRASYLLIFGFSIMLILGLLIGPRLPLEIIVFGLLFVIMGLFTLVMAQAALQGESVDHDEILTGKRRETTYSGMNALLTKPAVSLAHFLTLTIMVAFGFNEDLVVSAQPASVSTGVLISYTLVPIIFLIFGIIAMYKFPLDGPEWAEKKNKLLENRIRKENEYLKAIQENR